MHWNRERDEPDPLAELLKLARFILWRVRGALCDDAYHLFGVPPLSPELDFLSGRWDYERRALAETVRTWATPAGEAASGSDLRDTTPSAACSAADRRASSEA